MPPGAPGSGCQMHTQIWSLQSRVVNRRFKLEESESAAVNKQKYKFYPEGQERPTDGFKQQIQNKLHCLASLEKQLLQEKKLTLNPVPEIQKPLEQFLMLGLDANERSRFENQKIKR